MQPHDCNGFLVGMTACFLGRRSSSTKSNVDVRLCAFAPTIVFSRRFRQETDFDLGVRRFQMTILSVRIAREAIARLPGEQGRHNEGHIAFRSALDCVRVPRNHPTALQSSVVDARLH
jgi:hypothetical protein